MGVPTTAPSFLKIATIGMYVVVLIGIVVNIVSAGINFYSTGDWRPLIESTLGQVLYWDSQIYEGVSYLHNNEFINNLPETFRDDFKSFIVKQIALYLFLSALLFYGLFKAGNWILGAASFDPTTDIILVLVIIGLIALGEFVYGALMRGELVVPFRGFFQLFRLSTLKIIFESFESNSYGSYLQKNIDSNTNLNLSVNLAGGG